LKAVYQWFASRAAILSVQSSKSEIRAWMTSSHCPHLSDMRSRDSLVVREFLPSPNNSISLLSSLPLRCCGLSFFPLSRAWYVLTSKLPLCYLDPHRAAQNSGCRRLLSLSALSDVQYIQRRKCASSSHRLHSGRLCLVFLP